MKRQSLPLCGFLLLASISSASAQFQPSTRPPKVPDGATWANGSWFYLYDTKVPWDLAKKKCESVGGQLAVIKDAETWACVRKLVSRRECWLGGTDEKQEGTWKWVDGTPLSYTNWLDGEPNNSNNAEHYLSTSIQEDGWLDVAKGYNANLGYVCQWKSAETDDLNRLRERWREAKAQAVKPINAKYRQELQKLLDQATKAGKQDEAVALKKEIDAIE